MDHDDLRRTVEAALTRSVGEQRARAALASENMLETGFLDSFSLIELTADLEERLGIEIPADDIGGDAYQNVDALAEYCRKRLDSA